MKAPKRLRICDLNSGEELADVIAYKAWELAGQGKRPVRCIVFVDKREDAVTAKEEIERRARGDKKNGAEAVEIISRSIVRLPPCR